MKQKYSLWLFLLLVIAIPVLIFLVYSRYQKIYADLPIYGPVQTSQGEETFHSVPAFELVSEANLPVIWDEQESDIVVANFFFTYCPSICPKMTSELTRVAAGFLDKGIHFYSFTVDPIRDTPQRLQSFANKFEIDPNQWTLLTGDKKTIYKLARNGFFLTATDGDGGPNDFIHSEKVILLDQLRRIRGYYDGTDRKDMDRLIFDIKKLQNQQT
ncbi:MAG: SCO family protein [Saprospiraceae bacterium]|nr:SCO family protein [Saprospiraceae bacterium]